MTKSNPKEGKTPMARKVRRRILLDHAPNTSASDDASDLEHTGSDPRDQNLADKEGFRTMPPSDEAGDELDIGLHDDHPAVRAFYDEASEDDRVGYKNPPKKHRFRKGQSGNPSGKRQAPVIPPGTVIALIGKTVLEAISDLMRSPIRDLGVREDDNVATAFAKQIVADGVKKEGRSRALLIGYFVEPQRAADRYQPLDPSMLDAKMLGEMAQTIIDPTISDEEMKEKMDRWLGAKAGMAMFNDGPLDALPPLPKPRKARKTREARKPGSARRPRNAKAKNHKA